MCREEHPACTVADRPCVGAFGRKMHVKIQTDSMHMPKHPPCTSRPAGAGACKKMARHALQEWSKAQLSIASCNRGIEEGAGDLNPVVSLA